MISALDLAITASLPPRQRRAIELEQLRQTSAITERVAAATSHLTGWKLYGAALTASPSDPAVLSWPETLQTDVFSDPVEPKYVLMASSSTTSSPWAAPDPEPQAFSRASVETIFRQSRFEAFTSGELSDVSVELMLAVAEHGAPVVQQIHRLVFESASPVRVSAEALRILAEVQQPATLDMRRILLETCLSHRSSFVRDAALLGLAEIGDRGSIPKVRAAREVEPIESLRYAYDQVIEELDHR